MSVCLQTYPEDYMANFTKFSVQA